MIYIVQFKTVTIVTRLLSGSVEKRKGTVTFSNQWQLNNTVRVSTVDSITITDHHEMQHVALC